MKTIYYLLLLLFFFSGVTIATAQKSEWAWAKGAGGGAHDYGNTIATDLAGNVYLTGCFTSDTISFGKEILTNAGKGSSDIFIAKFNPEGELLWSSSIGGSANDHGLGICADNNGNAWITGDFESSSIGFGRFTLINTGSSDIFIAHFDPDGNVVWATGAGGKGKDIGISVTSDGKGNASLTGTFESSAIAFGGMGLRNVSPGDTADIFLAHFDRSGKAMWVKSMGGSSAESSSAIVTDKEGNIFITGMFSSPEITFETTKIENSTNAGFYGDIFIAKYQSDGSMEWVKSIGGTRFDKGTGISADASGNAYITGWFKSDSINFGCSVIRCTTLASAENDKIGDVFIAKYDPDGKPIWAKRAGGMAKDYSFSIAADIHGQVYLSGVFENNFKHFGDIRLHDASSNDIFITKYDMNGNELWGKSLYGAAMGHNITTDARGNLYLTGVFNSPEMQFSSTTLTNAGKGDVFLARMKN